MGSERRLHDGRLYPRLFEGIRVGQHLSGVGLLIHGGMTVHPAATPRHLGRESTGGQVEVESLVSGDIETFPAELVVVQTGRIAAPSPARAFEAHAIETHSIGDCVAPRRLSDAVREGYRIAAAL